MNLDAKWLAYNRAHMLLYGIRKTVSDPKGRAKLSRVLNYCGKAEYAELQDYGLSCEHAVSEGE